MVVQFLRFYGRSYGSGPGGGILVFAALLAVSACSNDTTRSPSSAEAKVGAGVENNAGSETLGDEEKKSTLAKVLTTRERVLGSDAHPLSCDKNGICAYSEPDSDTRNAQKASVLQTEGLKRGYKDIPFDFSPTEKVNEFGRFIVSAASFENFEVVNDLIPATQSFSGAPVVVASSPLISVNSFVSASNLSFSHCILSRPETAQSQSVTSNASRFPGMFAQYGMDTAGHWILVSKILANTTGPDSPPVWHRVEVISEVLSIQGKNPIELPKNERGMRFSTWMVSQVPYSIKSSVVLYPEGAFAGTLADAPVELSITTAWGLPRGETSPVSKTQSQVLTYSQVWECEAGVPCPKLLNDVPLYWYEETLAKGLGRGWKIKDKLSNLTWNGSGWKTAPQNSNLCGI